MTTPLPPAAGRRLRMVMAMRPTTPDSLHRFIRAGFGLDIGRTAVSRGSTPPFDYLCHAFFHGGDCVVWANRGGGKTMLGAVATLLDLVFKPGIQVRILGGSLEQSSKMYEHLRTLLDRPLLRDRSGSGDVLAVPATARRVVLTNGSRVEILAGSQRSVRGTRVHKLRCDEVEEFDPAVWEAAQLVTRSQALADGRDIVGSVEGLSTMHHPFGLMSKLVESADGAHCETDHQPLRVFKWNALDVVARCPDTLSCEGCPLWNDCEGRAKQATGFVPVEDLIAQRRRTSDLTWSAEMMCERPRVEASVYPNFDPHTPGKHVVASPAWLEPDEMISGVTNRTSGGWLGGMDFGLRSPHVMLWARVVGQGLDAKVHIIDEYHAAGLTLDRQLEAIEAQRQRHGWPPAGELDWVGVDPAGHQRDRHSGRTDIALVREAGYRVRSARSRIAEGIEIIRRRFDRDTLTIHPRCTELIKSLQSYRFPTPSPHRSSSGGTSGGGGDEPLKDGPDHACDALRYLLLNLERIGRPVATRNYLAGVGP
ncbi:MAG: hypothetical protein AAGJ38_04325 [Planctomycetota bacterium]